MHSHHCNQSHTPFLNSDETLQGSPLHEIHASRMFVVLEEGKGRGESDKRKEARPQPRMAEQGEEQVVDGTELGDKLRGVCESNNPDLSRAEKLIEGGALENLSVDEIGSILCKVAMKGHVDIMKKLLVSNRVDVNYRDPQYLWSPLLNAVQAEEEDMVDLLLEHGAEPGLRKKNGASPFIVAAITGNVNLLRKFLALGAGIDEADDNGFTAFMEAAQYGHEEALRFLFQEHANVNKGRQVSGARANIGKGGKTALIDAVMKGHMDIVEILLDEMNADVNAFDNIRKTPLIHALDGSNEEIVEALLKRGADVNAMDGNQNTPLSVALTKCTLRSPLLEQLVKCTQNLNVQDADGKTPLILAVEKKMPRVVKLLLENDSTELNAQDRSGQTALLAAVENKDTSLTEVLCKGGADVSRANNRGDTALMIAIRKYDNKTKNILIKHGAEKVASNEGRPPSRWKEHSVRWKESLRKLQVEPRDPVGKLKLSRIPDYKITGERNATEVCLGFFNNEIEVAVKCHRKGVEAAKRELDCLRDPKISGSSRFASLRYCESDDFCDYLCLDLCEYNLEECVSKWPDKMRSDAPKIMKQLVQALQILHKVKFAHRDLHPTNVLRDVEENFRLADFDKSVHFDKNPTMPICPGTWEASEILQKLERSPKAMFTEDELFKADVQALGRLLHFVISGGKDVYGSKKDELENNPSFDDSLCDLKNAEARDFVECLLAPAEQRATLTEIEHHPLLWKNLDKAQLIQSLANEKDVVKRNHDSQIVQILNKTGEDQERSFHKWTEKVDSVLLNDMNKRQGKNKEYKDTTSDLLKFIRNLIQHFDEKKEFHSLMKNPEDYSFGLFPDLIVAVYKAVKDTEWKKYFPKE
ncbi:2-5A-dependent ribonuclease-like isoform X2 [Chiloscyllium punctatum]|uniref:2-5A-dependent ribonuclease-like isoform X2 n=1 Tax=Chiloscyllium punctatum TaxID=137246 RepID=UPI003B636176